MNHLPASVAATAVDLGALSGLAPALASTFVALAGDIALVVDADADGVVRSVAAGEAGLGAAAQSWIGQPGVETSRGATRREIEQLLGEERAEGRARRREVNHPSALGLDIPVAWAAVRLGTEGPVLALVQCSTLISTYGAASSPPWRRCKSSRCRPASLRFAPCHEGESAGP